MNITAKSRGLPLQLVDIVRLKWMLAAEGVHVHVERAQSDPVYAEDCLALAAQSGNSTLRLLAEGLRADRGR